MIFQYAFFTSIVDAMAKQMNFVNRVVRSQFSGLKPDEGLK